MSDDRRPPKDIYPTADEIADRAYEMLRERGSRTFGAADYWRIDWSNVGGGEARLTARTCYW